MKRYFIIIAISIFSLTGNAQNMIQGEPSREMEAKAAQEAAEWTRELAMSLEQMELMEDKIIEFAMKKDEVIQSNLPAEEKRKVLNNLQKREYADMRDILTRPQFLRYMEINNARARRINERANN
ncbi:MAG TPA: hypothetical protein VFM70_09730 [Salinimicrobium sp.]|nr:hypothetical protein [Salinimicrobium sp.]